MSSVSMVKHQCERVNVCVEFPSGTFRVSEVIVVGFETVGLCVKCLVRYSHVCGTV